MAVVQKYFKNSTEGYIVCKTYSTDIKNSDMYTKNGKVADASVMKGCVAIKKEKYERELKYMKKNSIIE